jgi:NAD(P)-dependent dehydrogenase (short-subunit alcohol dehydrogenase family)
MLLAKHRAPKIVPGGSIVFTSGIASRRPSPTGSLIAALNGALTSPEYALAIELAPIRVNVVSPGWVDTPIWETLAGEGKEATLAVMANRLPLGRVGSPARIAHAMKSILHNGFTTGAVLPSTEATDWCDVRGHGV